MSPESAIRFGSASVRTTPFSSSASRTTFSAKSPVVERERGGAEARRVDQRPVAEAAAERDVAVREQEVGIGAELLDHLARHLGEADRQHHLLAAGDLHQVGDLARGVALGERQRPLHAQRVREASAQHQAVARRPHLDRLAGQQLEELGPQALDVVAHDQIDDRDQAAIAVGDREAGGAELLAEDVERVAGQRHDVGDLGIADRDLGERPIDFDHLRLVEGHQELASAGRRCPGGPATSGQRAAADGAVGTRARGPAGCS